MRKTYIIDTNILASDPEVIEKLEGNDVILPAVVLEELDNLKMLLFLKLNLVNTMFHY